MRNFYRFTSFLACIIFWGSFHPVIAQANRQKAHPRGSTDAPYGFYEYLPEGYEQSPDKKYPVLLFLSGLGEEGNGTTDLNKILRNGPPKLIQGGRSFPFIVISPQSANGWWGTATVDILVEYIKKNYRVDTDRFYLTGLSAGAMGAWQYTVAHPQKIAALVPIAGNGNGIELCNMSKVPVWIFHGDADNSVSIYGAITPHKTYNECTPTPNPLAKLTMYPGVGHDSWTRTYDGSAGHDIYSWMLSYSKSSASPPPANQAPTANAGTDKAITLPVNSVTLNGSGSDADGTIAKYAWAKVSGPAATLSNANTANLSLSSLVEGNYVFRLTVTDNLGATGSSDVKVTVNAAAPSPAPAPAPAPPSSGDCGCKVTIKLDQRRILATDYPQVLPGDKICLEPGVREWLHFEGFKGTKDKPITITNCSGQVIIKNNYRNGVISFSENRHFRFTGTGDSRHKYGIKIEEGGVDTAIRFGGGCSDFEVDHIEVAHAGFAGIMIKSDPHCHLPQYQRENFIMENLKVHDNYIHDVDGEGFYIGHYGYNGIDATCGKIYPHLIKNLKLYNNIVRNTGADGIQVACAPEGTEIYNNLIENYGKDPFAQWQDNGLIVGNQALVYNNTIRNGLGNGAGIQIFGGGGQIVFNNVIENSANMGIFCDERTEVVGEYHFYNNTIVNSRTFGVSLYGDLVPMNHFKNNLIISPSGQYLMKLNSNVKVQESNNYYAKDFSDIGFVDPAKSNFQLKEGSPAIDAGANLTALGVRFDFNNRPRPAGNGFDIGAFEYHSGGNTPPAFNGKMEYINPKCSGSSDGTATVKAEGGVAPYTYLWSNGKTTESINGLAAGNYSVTAKDKNGQEYKGSVTLSAPTALKITETITNESGAGNNGAVVLKIEGGVSPYTYKWSNGAATKDLSGLKEGTYTVTIKDKNGCELEKSFNVEKTIVVPALSAEISGVNVSCFGGSNGSAKLAVSGGAEPYQISWSNGKTTPEISALKAGAYVATIKDSKGASIEKKITIEEPKAISANGAIADENGAGNNGKIELSVSGGTAPYTYKWSNGATTKDVSGLKEGSYTVAIKDANGCELEKSFVVGKTIEVPALSAEISKKDASCFGGSNGSAKISISGGAEPYQISWSNGKTTPEISALKAGAYVATIKDSKGASIKKTAIIEEPKAIAGNGKVTNENGAGNNGKIELSVSGGTAPYAYKWSNGATTKDVSGLKEGSYTVAIKDANGCELEKSFVVGKTIEIQPLSVEISKKDVSCFGGSNGSAKLLISGGALPYEISWSNGKTTPEISALKAGNYDVTIKDSDGRTIKQSIAIKEPSALSATASFTDGSDPNQNDKIILTVSGGTPPYSYAWSTGATTKDVYGLSSGTYSVSITDKEGCELRRSFNLKNNITTPNLNVEVNAKGVTCFGGNDGSANAKITGGSEPYSIRWSNGKTTSQVTDLTPGRYTVVIKDNSGKSISRFVNIGQPAEIVVSGTVSNETPGSKNGSITLSVEGGNAPFRYTWSTGATTKDATGLSPGVYDVSVVDKNGCEANKTFVVDEAPAETPSLDFHVAWSNVTCYGGSNGAASVEIIGGVGPFNIKWQNGETTPNIMNLKAGGYIITVTDKTGASLTKSFDILEPSKFEAKGYIIHEHGPGKNGKIILTVSGGAKPYSYEWSNGSKDKDVSGLASGPYSVKITDKNGCETTKTFNLINISKETKSPVVLKVYPNPTHGRFNISIDNNSAKVSKCRIVNVFGYTIFEKDIEVEQEQNITLAMDYSHISRGVYYVEVTYNNFKAERKRVIIY